MTYEQDYLQQVKEAISQSRAGDGAGVPDAETLLANLSARGLVVVEVPPGVKHDFTGIVA